MGDHLGVEDHQKVWIDDFTNLIDSALRNPHITLDGGHPLFGAEEGDESALSSPDNNSVGKDMRSRHHSLTTDSGHPDIIALHDLLLIVEVELPMPLGS